MPVENRYTLLMTFRPLLLSVFLISVAATLVFAEPVPQQKTIIPKGSENAGKTLFVGKGCYQCHVADGIRTPASELDENLTIDLGGSDHAGWSRDDFARSIMNPNHTVPEEYRKIMMTLGDNLKAENSPMPGFNDMLTISDLIHLTTFLESITN